MLELRVLCMKTFSMFRRVCFVYNNGVCNSHCYMINWTCLRQLLPFASDRIFNGSQLFQQFLASCCFLWCGWSGVGCVGRRGRCRRWFAVILFLGLDWKQRENLGLSWVSYLCSSISIVVIANQSINNWRSSTINGKVINHHNSFRISKFY